MELSILVVIQTVSRMALVFRSGKLVTNTLGSGRTISNTGLESLNGRMGGFIPVNGNHQKCMV